MSHLLPVLNKLVHFAIATRHHEVSEENRLAGHHLLKAAAELLNALLEQLIEPVPVLRTYQSVLEHAAALMVPQLQELHLVLEGNTGTVFLKKC